MHDQEDMGEDDTLPSKSELKRRMLALQELDAQLVELNDKQLAQVPVDDERLEQAIREARQIRSNSARRRHLQFIGKLMRDIDPEPIRRALENMHQRRQKDADDFHQLEQLREEILNAGPAGIELAVKRWPQAESVTTEVLCTDLN